MSERRLRLILASVMFVTLFLPWNPPPDVRSNWTVVLLYCMEASRIFCPRDLLFGLAVPLLTLSNVYLSIHPSKRWKILYRVLIPITFLVIWHVSFLIGPRFRGVGFWANIATVSTAMLLEIVFVVRERRGKSTGASP
jgi:hypothetical protein